MKKIIAILLAVTLAFTFAACGKGTAEPSNGMSNSGGSAENS